MFDRKQLTGFHEVAFVHHVFPHPSLKLGGDVDLGGLDATIAANNPDTRTGWVDGNPYQDSHHNDRDDCRHYHSLFLSCGVMTKSTTVTPASPG